jgi:hypothetical protein
LTEYPAVPMSLASALRTEGSSSTMQTVAAGVVISFVSRSLYFSSEEDDWQYQGPAGRKEVGGVSRPAG